MTEFQIRTERLILRPWSDADIRPFTEMVLSPGFSAFLLPVNSQAAARDWVMGKRAHFKEHGFGPWVVELAQTGDFIGCIGLSVVPYEAVFTPAVEIAWRLAKAHRGNGYATEAAKAVLADGFGRLGLREIVANTAPANLPSRRVMQRIGMTHVLDFEHPLLPVGHPLRNQVLYRASAPGPGVRLTSVSIKRVYEPPTDGDGTRVLVDRLWPRGMSKDQARIDLWLKDIAPSDALRKRFHGKPDDWDAFCAAYAAELEGPPAQAAVQELADRARNGPVTLLYAARDEHHNNAVALKAWLEKHRATRG